MSSETTEYLTRDGVHVLLKEHGFPIGRSTIDKIAMRTCDPVTRARYKGRPPVAAYVRRARQRRGRRGAAAGRQLY
jgi:hypothetical protein